MFVFYKSTRELHDIIVDDLFDKSRSFDPDTAMPYESFNYAASADLLPLTCDDVYDFWTIHQVLECKKTLRYLARYHYRDLMEALRDMEV